MSIWTGLVCRDRKGDTIMQTLTLGQVSRKNLYSGVAISAVPTLFLIFDAVIKLIDIPAVTEAMDRLGYPQHLTTPIALIEIACLLLYIVPRTAPLGAVLMTGFLGGAV